MGELTVRQVDAEHLRVGMVGQPCRERTASAGHLEDPAGRGPVDGLQVALVGSPVGGCRVGRVVARFEYGEMEELAPVRVIQLG